MVSNGTITVESILSLWVMNDAESVSELADYRPD